MGGDGPREGPSRGGARLTVFGIVPAGGAGTRLWPRSRRAQPKHMLDVAGDGEALVVKALKRLRPLVDELCVLTESAQAQGIESLLSAFDRLTVISEPEARGTANALGLAALTLTERDPDAMIVSTAADHLVRDEAEFGRAVRLAETVAGAEEVLVTIGLEPRFPATGYGYIRTGRETADGVHEVEAFVEKPDRERAEEFLARGRHLWNLSMFCWRARVFLEELARVAPAHEEGLRRVMQLRAAGDQGGAAAAYASLPVEAVDYAVLEKTRRLRVVVARFDWTDVGSWSEIHELLPKDQAGNAVEGDAVLLDTRDSLISAPGRLVAAVGVEGLAIVEAGDALLVCPLDRAQDVKKIVDELRRRGSSNYL